MTRLIRTTGEEQGEILNKWFYNRMIKRNKNVLCVTTGQTGSSKSYQDLKKAESWYEYYFKEKFPPENICFSVAEIMRRLSSGKLKRGELLIFEEAGANLGSLDFQTRVSKLFTYVLQSFRSLNVGILFNLPYLTMLNKQARMLVHVHFVTSGIDFNKKVSKAKAYFRQINPTTGKVYPKFMRIKNGRGSVKVSKFTFDLPTKELLDTYEQKKFKFVHEMSVDFSAELDKIERDKLRKMERDDLTERERKVLDMTEQGMTLKEIAEIFGVSFQCIGKSLQNAREKGFKAVRSTNSLGNQPNSLLKPLPTPF